MYDDDDDDNLRNAPRRKNRGGGGRGGRGKGRGHGSGKDRGDYGRGRDDDHGRDYGRGRDDDRGRHHPQSGMVPYNARTERPGITTDDVAEGIALVSQAGAVLIPMPSAPPAATGNPTIDHHNAIEHSRALTGYRTSQDRISVLGRVLAALIRWSGERRR